MLREKKIAWGNPNRVTLHPFRCKTCDARKLEVWVNGIRNRERLWLRGVEVARCVCPRCNGELSEEMVQRTFEKTDVFNFDFRWMVDKVMCSTCGPLVRRRMEPVPVT